MNDLQSVHWHPFTYQYELLLNSEIIGKTSYISVSFPFDVFTDVIVILFLDSSNNSLKFFLPEFLANFTVSCRHLVWLLLFLGPWQPLFKFILYNNSVFIPHFFSVPINEIQNIKEIPDVLLNIRSIYSRFYCRNLVVFVLLL